MSLVGLDLNSSRVRGVGSNGRQPPQPLALEREAIEFPLALSLESRTPTPGQAALKLLRSRPHRTCIDFLPHLGTARVWTAARGRLTAEDALKLCLSSLGRSLNRVVGMGFCLPPYLDPVQVQLLYHICHSHKISLYGSISVPLAAVLARLLADPAPLEPSIVLVVDVDGYALTWNLVDATSGEVSLLQTQVSPGLSRSVWLRRLGDGIAARFIRQCRHDPREEADTDQALYDQILPMLSREAKPTYLPVGLQGATWSSHLMVPSEDLVGFVGSCLQQTAAELDSILHGAQRWGGVGTALITGSAAALPGLTDLVRSRLQRESLAVSDEADYGDAIVQAIGDDRVRELSDDALALAAFELASRVQAGQLARGPHESLSVPTAGAAPPDDGPPRLQFRGQEHLLQKVSFVLGRDPGCDLVFESELYPHVSARHAEVVFDRRHFLIYDRSRHGTLVNDQAIDRQAPLHSGDWIRLGPQGPVLRFLGVPQRGGA
jgi:hypothetical protein